MTLGFLWLMLALKIPLIALIVVVWWAIKQRPAEPPASDDRGGGSKLHHPHTPQPVPRMPRRGPHGGTSPPAPARVRTVRARARTLEH